MSTTWKLLNHHKGQRGDEMVDKPGRHQRDRVTSRVTWWVLRWPERLPRLFLPGTWPESGCEEISGGPEGGVGPQDGMHVPNATAGPGREPDQEGRRTAGRREWHV